MRGRAALITVIALAGMLTACARDGESVTVDPAAPPPTTAARLTLDGPGRKLTADEVKRALVGRESLPPGQNWVKRDEGYTTAHYWSSGDVIEPRTCHDVLERLWDQPDGYEDAGVEYRLDGELDKGSLTIYVRSWDDVSVPSAHITDVASLPQSCPSYVQHTKYVSGVPYDMRWGVVRADFPRPGDASAAMDEQVIVSARGKDEAPSFVQFSLVQVGHNEIYVESWGKSKVPTEHLTRLLNDALRQLAEVTK